MTAPFIFCQILNSRCAKRITMNVPYQFKQISIFFNENRLEPSPKELTVKTMQAIVALSINTIQMTHESGKTALRGLQKKVIMVFHKTKRTYPDIPQLNSLLEQGYEDLITVLIGENIFPPSSPVHYMIPGIRVFYS